MADRKPHLLGCSAPPHSFNKQQMLVLSSICDTLIPSIVPFASLSSNERGNSGNSTGKVGSNEGPVLVHPPAWAPGDSEDGKKDRQVATLAELDEFFALSGSENGTPEEAAGLMAHLSPKAVGQLSTVLTLLSWSVGTLLLAGRWALDWRFPFVHPFPALPLAARERILQSWATGASLDLRALFKAFKGLAMLAFYGKVDAAGRNPAWSAIGYPGPDPQRAQKVAAKGRDTLRRPLEHAVLDLQESLEKEGDIAQVLRNRGFEASQGLHSSDLTVKCDVVVVGSGSGGGVVAGQLAQAGYKVLVLEKGRYFSRDDLSLLELPSLQTMYEKGALWSTDDGGVAILAGTTVGGGSAVNWSASFRTQPHVIREWVDELGLKKFGAPEYEEALEAVCRKGGVQTERVVHNLPNEVLRRGCHKLGYHVGVVPRNAETEHECGWCGFGCAAGDKKATSETWLVDAAKAGALILTRVEANRILVEPSTDPLSSRQHRATGVVAKVGDRRLTVQARITVAAAGALHTPALLLRSGLENPNIGKHLHVHPVSAVWGYFPEEAGPPGRMYEGGIMTAFSREVAHWDTTGYGALLMTVSSHPAMFAANLSWTSGASMKERMARYARTVQLIAITRDRSEGYVSISKRGQPVIHYWPGPAEQEHLLTGAEHNLRVLAAAGAHELGTLHVSGPRFRPAAAGMAEPPFEAWLAGVRQQGIQKHSVPIGSAHQMGSCRMGRDPHTSVVDEAGHSWEVEGLFLGDASVFPTATGTNPMITVQAIAYCTSQTIKQYLADR